MSWQLSAVAALFVSLAVISHDGHQIRAKAFPGTRDYLQPTTASTGQATAKPLLQPTNQVPHKTSAARSTDSHTTSQTAAETSNSENPTHTTVKTPTTIPVTTKSPPSTSPTSYTLATFNSTHTAAPITEATVGPASVPHSQPPLTSPSSSPGTSPRTGKTIQPTDPTTLPKTSSAAPHKSTTHQKPTPPTHTPGTTTDTHNATQTASPVPTVPWPTLAPWPSSTKTGTYQVLNGSRLCIKAEMGIELIVQEKESVFSPQRYFNIDPNATQASGRCGYRKSNLLLNFQGGFVNLTFTKEENSYYISEVGAHLTVSHPEKTYQGMKSAMVMFETGVGHSFKCVSEQSVQLSAQLQLKTMNVQLQAFDFEGDRFGNADECFHDRNRREIPVAVGLSITGLLVVLLTACLVARKRPSRGYELDECSSDYTIVLPVIGAVVVGLCVVGLGVYTIRLRRQSSGYQRI